jgi:hypothetical protein
VKRGSYRQNSFLEEKIWLEAGLYAGVLSHFPSRIIEDRGSGMAKQRGYPDRRGMGSESDLISEKFVPSEQYKAQQKIMAQTLIAAGLSPEQIASMLF